MPRTNRQPDVFDLGFQSKKDEKDDFLHDRPMDDSSDEYIDQFMNNLPSHLDLLVSDIFMENNLGDEHNQIDFRILSKRQQVTYIINAARRTGFPLLADAFIAQLCNFTRI